jgi:hypothetical protein
MNEQETQEIRVDEPRGPEVVLAEAHPAGPGHLESYSADTLSALFDA